jgi:ferredoxin-NADP reductase
MSLNTFPLVLKETRTLTPSVRHFVFAPPEGAPEFVFTPGQFITIHFEIENQLFRRSYSIATIPGQSGTVIEFAASYVKDGPGSELLFRLKVGEVIQATGPFGRLILRPDEISSRYVLVATGTGVTPYRTMLPQIKQRLLNQPDLAVVLLLGVRNREELLYGSDFTEFERLHPRFKFIAKYSREIEKQLEPFEQAGYVQTSFEHLNLNAQEDIVYLCGNPNMIDDAFAQLRSLGFDTHRIRREKYISSTAKSAE